jgi:hypothetical protein
MPIHKTIIALGLIGLFAYVGLCNVLSMNVADALTNAIHQNVAAYSK